MSEAPWKGLDPDRVPVFLGYDRTEQMVAALLDRAAAWRPDGVVGIARGGIVPATMAATLLGLDLALVGFERATGAVAPIGPKPSGRRLLVVDDGASTGRTLEAVRNALVAAGADCLTLAVVHDPDGAVCVPDLSHPMRDLWRFPWERGEATPAGRARRAAGLGPDRRTEAPFVALDAEGVLLAGPPWPDFAPDRAVAVTSRPERDSAEAAAALAACGWGAMALECCPPGQAPAAHKVAVAIRWGCTHLVEADPAQAIAIAADAPHLLVTWWNATEARGYVVSAAGMPSSITGPPAAAASSGSCVTSSTGRPRA